MATLYWILPPSRLPSIPIDHVKLRLLQGSDFHLTPRASGSGRFPDEVRNSLAAAGLESFRRFCSLARKEAVDAVLIPGDLFDGESVEEALLREVLHALSECQRPVFLAPGNHDYFSSEGYWSSSYRERRSIPWPENVHLFSKGEFESVRLPLPTGEASVTGLCFRSDQAPGCGLDTVPPSGNGIHLLMFHGSFLERTYPGKSQPLPFGRQDLLSLGFDYCALGHYHSHIEIQDGSGGLRGAYGGNPQPRWFGEVESSGALLIEIEKRDGKSVVQSELVPLAQLLLLELPIRLDGCGTETEAAERLRAALDEAGIGPRNIVRVQFEGVVAPTLTPELLEALDPQAEWLYGEIHAGRVLPDYDLDVEPGPEDVSVEAAFRRRMLARLAEAREAGDAEAEHLYRSAFAYGMDALRRQEVIARHVD